MHFFNAKQKNFDAQTKFEKFKTKKRNFDSHSNQLLTTIPHVSVIPRPQYVLGTISPYPTHKKVIAVSHIEFNKFACSSS